MCPKTPKPQKQETKKPQYLRNPFLDGLALGSNAGRNSLRIDLGTPVAAPITPAVPFVPTPGIVVPSERGLLGGSGSFGIPYRTQLR